MQDFLDEINYLRIKEQYMYQHLQVTCELFITLQTNAMRVLGLITVVCLCWLFDEPL